MRRTVAVKCRDEAPRVFNIMTINMTTTTKMMMMIVMMMIVMMIMMIVMGMMMRTMVMMIMAMMTVVVMVMVTMMVIPYHWVHSTSSTGKEQEKVSESHMTLMGFEPLTCRPQVEAPPSSPWGPMHCFYLLVVMKRDYVICSVYFDFLHILLKSL